ncbi:endogenous retrovirus group K member 13-1 Env polyprotein-like [Nycticebus coucang]|uniref:endogenous retrovirus group K member 13-1 Env polyprotein-like n=1 Tax=Nycticebus coucang TaxID=9470 RepID=UPI00234D5015|nr:endogenous retrovirus group K member 13-1 Env polyprotein-like [Nycticebus coucang]
MEHPKRKGSPSEENRRSECERTYCWAPARTQTYGGIQLRVSGRNEERKSLAVVGQVRPVDSNICHSKQGTAGLNLVDCLLNFQSPTLRIFLLRAKTGVCLPVKMMRSWEESPAISILADLAWKLTKRTKRFISLLIAAILGIIAVTASAAGNGIALTEFASN